MDKFDAKFLATGTGMTLIILLCAVLESFIPLVIGLVALFLYSINVVFDNRFSMFVRRQLSRDKHET